MCLKQLSVVLVYPKADTMVYQHLTNIIQEHLPTNMIKLRLKRYGKKRSASYRIVAINSRDRRDGRPLEELGYYNPITDETRLSVESIVKRLQDGAQPTDTVRRILEKANIFELVRA